MDTSTIIFYLIIGLAIIIVVRAVFLVIRNTKRKNKWLPTIKPGDICKTSYSNEYLNFEIIEVKDEEVVVKTTIGKRWIHPKK